MTDTLDGMLSNSDPDPANSSPIDLAPLSSPTGIPGSEPPSETSPLPPGVHPMDQSVPLGADGSLLESDGPPSSVGPAGAPATRHKPWHRDNEDALPVFQRAAHDWSVDRYIVQAANAPNLLSGRMKGRTRTVVWVPTGSALGVMIAPTMGEVQQGSGIVINPGDPPLNIDSEASVYGGVIPGNAAGGPVQIIRYYNPPGGGLGLSSS
jgi:hypothetical protein